MLKSSNSWQSLRGKLKLRSGDAEVSLELNFEPAHRINTKASQQRGTAIAFSADQTPCGIYKLEFSMDLYSL